MKYFLFLIILFKTVANATESPHLTTKIKVNFQSKNDAEYFLRENIPNRLISNIFDNFNGTKIIIHTFNDYDFKDPNADDPNSVNDDLGLTHGMKFEVYKNIAPTGFKDQYYLLISYETSLFTNSDRPEEFQENYRDVVYKNEDNIYQADIYFKESNRLSALFGSLKKENAYFWNAGLGYQELNTEDYERGFILSSISQQKWQHQNLNKWFDGKYREYNYLPEDKNQYGFYFNGSIGRDITISKSQNIRTFSRAQIRTQLHQLKNASSIGFDIELGFDYNSNDKKWFKVPVRIQAQYKIDKYFDSNLYQEINFEVRAEFDHLSTSFKYIIPLTHNPDYLNPLPLDFVNRESSKPSKEPIIWFTLEGKI